jgi:alkylation response protein AidB-like acyl-CoA dehydrogenase
MGPKLGFNSKDNGWLIMTNVRIPRSQMLSKFVSVDREGSFSIEGDLRALYATMMGIRTLLIEQGPYTSTMATTIAIRYSAVRRQFANTPGSKQETKLIDYQTQQAKLAPLIADALLMYMSARFVKEQYRTLLTELEQENFERLDSLHHLTSGFKSLFTQLAHDNILTARQSIGGAGYTAWSGINNAYDLSSPTVTFEGDNTVMGIQSANYIKRLLEQLKKGEKIKNPIYNYLNDVDSSL